MIRSLFALLLFIPFCRPCEPPVIIDRAITVTVVPVLAYVIVDDDPFTVEWRGYLDSPPVNTVYDVNRVQVGAIYDPPPTTAEIELRQEGSPAAIGYVVLTYPARAGAIEPAAPVRVHPGERLEVVWRGNITKAETLTAHLSIHHYGPVR